MSPKASRADKIPKSANKLRRYGDETALRRYLTLTEAAEMYPVFTPRLLRRLVQERRIAFSRAGRLIVLSDRDIEAYLERNRVEPFT